MKIHDILLMIITLFGLFSIFSMYILGNQSLFEIGTMGFFGFMLLDIFYMIGDIIRMTYQKSKKN